MRGAVLATWAGCAQGSRSIAAALACAASGPDRAALLVELSDGPGPRPAIVASTAARALEERLAAHLPEARVASRGSICHVSLAAGAEGIERAPAALALARDSLAVLHVAPGDTRQALEEPRLRLGGALLRADLGRDRALVGLAVRELLARGLEVSVAKRALGWVAARRALLGAMPADVRGAIPPHAVARLMGGAR